MNKIVSYTISAMILMGLLISCEDSPKKAWVVSTLADSGTPGSENGVGTAARFNYPTGVAVDSFGNIYVADFFNHLIQKISPEGDVITLAGSGTAGFAKGVGTAALFYHPTGVAVDSSGNIYVADSYNHRIRKITPAGKVSTLAGSETSVSEDGTVTEAQFNYPYGVAVDLSGNIYVADSFNHRIRKITTNSSGDVSVSTIAGSGTAGFANGVGKAAQFNKPTGVAVDSYGNIYVADSYNHRIRKITRAGEVSTLAGSGTKGFADGTGRAAQFNYPYGVAVDSFGNIYVAGNSNHRIRKITTDSSGDVSVSTLAGSEAKGFANGVGKAAKFNNPKGVVIDTFGNIYVADTGSHRIRKIEYKVP